MNASITILCPDCQSAKIKKNGRKHYDTSKQNYFCKDCQRQFVADHQLTYKGCLSKINQQIQRHLVRGSGIRDISEIECVSKGKVLSVLLRTHRRIVPKQSHYDELEIDEFWTYVGKKKNKVWLIYAYHRATGEIVAYVWGKRNYETAKKLRDKLKNLCVAYDAVCTDNWDSFRAVFQQDNHKTGKEYTKGIEGNNCRLRHRIRRAFRKTCCFSKKIKNHLMAFALAFYYINYGVI